MAELQIAHTADLGPRALAASRALLYDVFGDMTEQDWDHALGGIHTLVWEGGEVIGHAAVIQRQILHGGRALRAGYLEGVGVREDRRHRGHGAAMMDALERVTRRAYNLGALGATDEAAGWYESRGWQRWRGRCFAFTPAGVVRTEEDEDCVHVLPVTVPLNLSGDLTCDWRDGDVW